MEHACLHRRMRALLVMPAPIPYIQSIIYVIRTCSSSLWNDHWSCALNHTVEHASLHRCIRALLVKQASPYSIYIYI